MISPQTAGRAKETREYIASSMAHRCSLAKHDFQPLMDYMQACMLPSPLVCDAVKAGGCVAQSLLVIHIITQGVGGQVQGGGVRRDADHATGADSLQVPTSIAG
jgi:hypothetical protein